MKVTIVHIYVCVTVRQLKSSLHYLCSDVPFSWLVHVDTSRLKTDSAGSQPRSGQFSAGRLREYSGRTIQSLQEGKAYTCITLFVCGMSRCVHLFISWGLIFVGWWLLNRQQARADSSICRLMSRNLCIQKCKADIGYSNCHRNALNMEIYSPHRHLEASV